MDCHHTLCHVVVGVLIKRWFSFSLVTLWTTEENMKEQTQPVFDQDLDLQAFWTQCAKAVADPGFPRRGRQLPRAVRQSITLQNFDENCMKMKGFRLRGGARFCRPTLNPPLKWDIYKKSRVVVWEETILTI